jgi:adenine-specific DNA methylase
VRAQLAAQRGGADVVFDAKGRRAGGARLLAVVTLKPGEPGRHYRLPTERDYEAVRKAQARLAAILEEWERGGKQGLCPVPDEPAPAGGGSGAGRAFSVQKYGMLQWGDLFTARQKVALVTLARLVREHPHPHPLSQRERCAVSGVREALRAPIALLIGKGADGNSCLSRWMAGYENPVNCFSRQALPIVWDFCESAITSHSRGVFLSSLSDVKNVIQASRSPRGGQVQQADATEHPLPDETAQVWFTDPPYYDAIPYADLSDFFFVWLKRALPGHPLLRDPFDPANPLTPKAREAVQNERSETEDGRPKDKDFGD